MEFTIMSGMMKQQSKLNKLIFTIFGSTGDLAYRKLMPAFYNLFCRGLVEDDVIFLAIGRRSWDREKYISEIKDGVKEFSKYEFSEEKFEVFAKHIDYFEMQFTESEDYQKLFNYYSSFPWAKNNDTKHIFYLAVAPRFFATIADNLAKTGCLRGECRAIIEKPFGPDPETAKATSLELERAFGEGQVYHIDHYLGKNMVQNLYTLRVENKFLDAILNKDFVKSIRINALEKIDIGDRGAFYDQTGALGDMIQSHLFLTLIMLVMDCDAEKGSKNYLDAQIKLLKNLRDPNDIENNLIVGQYDGYRDHDEVDPASQTETFAALRVFIDNPRWENVEFLLRSGKATEEKLTNVEVLFKSGQVLCIEIDPNPSITWTILADDANLEESTTKIDLSSDAEINKSDSPEAYERLVYSCYLGKKEYFPSWEQIEITWEWILKLQNLRRECNIKLEPYSKGSKGPDSQAKMYKTKD